MKAELSYTPREAFKPFHSRTTRFAAMVCHRRAGKTVASINELIIRALYTKKKNARYAYIAPFYRQAKDTAWTYLKEAAAPFVESNKEVRESELRVRLINGAWITLYGSDNPDTLRGIYLDGVILDEFGDCRPSLWTEVVLPTLADRNGWATFIGTPKGRNHFYQIVQRAKQDPDWFFLDLRASQSNLIPQDTLRQIKSQMTPEQYRQEFENDFSAAVEGTYYASIIDELEQSGRISEQPLYDPDMPVFTACDLGFSDSTAFWFWQPRPDGVAVIDYHEEHGKSLDYYFNMLEDKPYQYDTMYLPHDARAKTLQTGRSTIEQFLERFNEDTSIQIAPQLKIQHGIDAARLVLRHCWIDSRQCGGGIEALRAYKRRYNEVTKAYADKPEHNWASHGADGFRYMALVVQMNQKPAPISEEYKKQRLISSLNSPKGHTLNDLFKEHESRLNKSGFMSMRV